MLKLRGTPVDDLAVAEIGARMGMIREIDLSKTKVTDEAIVHLSAMRMLQSVNLRGSQTSGAGALRLHEILEPNCTVFDAGGTCLVARRYRRP